MNVLTRKYWRHSVLAVRLTLLLLIVPLSACSALDVLNATVPDIGYSLISDVSYGELPRQKLDIYIPTQASSDAQLVVFVYGGAWRKGNKSDYRFVAQALSSAGHTVVIPDYRLYPHVVFPDFVNDIAQAIRSLSNPQLFSTELANVDRTNVVLMGHSSGAHLISLISADSRYLDKTGISIKAMIGLSGPYDLPLDNKEVAAVFDSAPNPDNTNPLTLATTDHPATLLIHGSDDRRVKPKHTQRYHAALQSLSVDSQLLMIEDAGHAAIVASIAKPLQSRNNVTPAILNYLERL